MVARAPSRPAADEVVGVKTQDVLTEPLWRGERLKSRPAADEVVAKPPPLPPEEAAKAEGAGHVQPPPLPADQTLVTAATPGAAPNVPMEQVVVELQRRIAELERGPNSVPADMQTRVEGVKARVQPVQAAPRFVPPVGPAPVYARSVSEAPPPAAYSSGDLDIESPFDGRKRRRKVVVRFVVLIVIVFGGLLGLMGYSYLPQARVMLTR
jgi:hypothetical protein